MATNISINLFLIAAMFLSLFLFWFFSAVKKRPLMTTPAFYCFFSGCCILTLPLTYTSDSRIIDAGWRILGLSGGLFFLFSCLQLHYRRRLFLGMIYGLLFIITVQAFIAYQQLWGAGNTWVPLYGKRVYGTFFQANVLASFIATGIALILMLLLLPGLALTRPSFERYRQTGLLILLTALTTLLIWIQSRAGWIGGTVAVLLLVLCFGHRRPIPALIAVVSLSLGMTLGLVSMLGDKIPIEQVNHAASNQARWTMLRDTLAMIADKPYSGWGYGGFGYDFQHFRTHKIPPTEVTEVAFHPHNELLLWVVEGGIFGLLGMILIVAGLWRVVCQSVRWDRMAFDAGYRMAGVPTALCITLLPITIHTQLEFPFYLSALHFSMFLLLLAMADRLSARPIHMDTSAPSRTTRALSGVLCLLALCVSTLAGFALKGSIVLAQVEKFQLEDVTPLKNLPFLSRWLNQERVVFDEQVNALLTYNRTRNEQLLTSYRQWAQAYLLRRIDKNVYASLILILHHQNMPLVADRYRCEAARFFPQDPRFFPIGADIEKQ